MSDVKMLLEQLADMQSKLQGLVDKSSVSRKRDLSKAAYLDGACPAPLKACDPDEEAKFGRACPDLSEYAPDPLIVDSEGRVCYAPEDLAKWAGDRNLSDIDTLIERAAAQLLMQLNDKSVLETVKRKMLEANVVAATNPRMLTIENSCSKTNAATGDCEWTSPLIGVDLEMDKVNEGLTKAKKMWLVNSGDTSTKWKPWSATFWQTWGLGVGDTLVQGLSKITGFNSAVAFATGTDLANGLDYVFHAYNTPWNNTVGGTVDGKYDKAINPATLAYAGAFAWAFKADQMLSHASSSEGPVKSKYVALVADLPAVILQANIDIAEGLVAAVAEDISEMKDGKAVTKKQSKFNGLKNLTFDVAWPMFMERTIGIKGLRAAAKTVKALPGTTPEAFNKMSASEQWDMIIKQYKRGK